MVGKGSSMRARENNIRPPDRRLIPPSEIDTLGPHAYFIYHTTAEICEDPIYHHYHHQSQNWYASICTTEIDVAGPASCRFQSEASLHGALPIAPAVTKDRSSI